MSPPCDWCGSLLPGRRVAFQRGEGEVSLHLWLCWGRWVETERALGHAVPGEKRWRPKKGGRK